MGAQARLEAEAFEAYRAAREHKRAAGRHRRLAQTEMQRFEALRARLRAFGVELVIDGGAVTHGQNAQTGRRAG